MEGFKPFGKFSIEILATDNADSSGTCRLISAHHFGLPSSESILEHSGLE